MREGDDPNFIPLFVFVAVCVAYATLNIAVIRSRFVPSAGDLFLFGMFLPFVLTIVTSLICIQRLKSFIVAACLSYGVFFLLMGIGNVYWITSAWAII